MFDLMTSSGRARALKSVEHDASHALQTLLAQGGDMVRAVGRGGTPAWLTAGGAVLAAGALYWLIRPATAQEAARKPRGANAVERENAAKPRQRRSGPARKSQAASQGRR